MSVSLQDKQASQLAPIQSDVLHQVLRMLGQAWRYAVDASMDPWQFAVELSEFERVGVTKSDLRWMTAHRYVIPAIETTLQTHSSRQFSALMNVRFPEGTCFVCSEQGLELLFKKFEGLRQTHRAQIKIISSRKSSSHSRPQSSVQLPTWDQSPKILRLGVSIIKQFRCPAPNQELVIAAFQESGWETRIDDPLPILEDQDPRRRLNETIKSLNRSQINKLICFRGDGTGTGVLWELNTSNSI